ncbi:MAG: hypothetical protein QF824_02075 [Candidatus Woesearchaeota archaeon]|nr:hypothetical protein [Candidatus Woesearchaeota archaeon]
MKKGVILSSIRDVVRLISKNKRMFLVMAVIQLIFFSLLAVLLSTYVVKIGISASKILEYVESTDLDEAAVTTKMLKQEEFLGDDPTLIFRESKTIISSLIFLFVYLLLLFLVLEGLNWALMDGLIRKKKFKEIFSYIGKFSGVLLVYLSFLFLFLRAIFIGVNLENFSFFDLIPLLFVVVLFYFMFLSLALVGGRSFKEIFKRTFLVGIRKWDVMLLSYLLMLVVMGLLTALWMFLAEMHIILVVLSLLLFVVSFILMRIFLVVVVDKA